MTGISAKPGESGTQYGLTDTAVETRSGVWLIMSYDAAAETFRGEVVGRPVTGTRCLRALLTRFRADGGGAGGRARQ